MGVDQIGTAAALEPSVGHPALDRLREIIDTVIAPAAVATDAGEVPASHLAALAEAGLLGLAIPAEHGGLGAPPQVVAEAYELLAGACPSTYLVVSQHATPARWILDGDRPGPRRLLRALARGERIGGAAYGHVRSWPRRRTVTARRVPGGWRLTGVVPWLSGAGLVDLVLLGAVAERERAFVFALVDLPQPDHVETVPLGLAAINGSRTVALRLHDLFVPEESVLRISDAGAWKARDGLDGPGGDPGSIGLARAAVGYALARRPGDPALRALAEEVAAFRRRRAVPQSDDDVFRLRAEAAGLAVRATTAAIVAGGGSALLAGDPAQVWARAALFFHVRGLSERQRQAHLGRLAQASAEALAGTPSG